MILLKTAACTVWFHTKCVLGWCFGPLPCLGWVYFLAWCAGHAAPPQAPQRHYLQSYYLSYCLSYYASYDSMIHLSDHRTINHNAYLLMYPIIMHPISCPGTHPILHPIVYLRMHPTIYPIMYHIV